MQQANNFLYLSNTALKGKSCIWKIKITCYWRIKNIQINWPRLPRQIPLTCSHLFSLYLQFHWRSTKQAFLKECLRYSPAHLLRIYLPKKKKKLLKLRYTTWLNARDHHISLSSVSVLTANKQKINVYFK